MLKLKEIVKQYKTGDMTVDALRGVSVEFRKSEFVSILGPSGCGKTTLLNIIGGLDAYTSGDLVISGRSTKLFSDSDWDTYRNHSIGFVFQSYNLIPHQTVLANVELALTLSGVSGAERRKRAVDALESVGLGDQLNKKPNEMSGGQMQRVAIARALVNDPEILLADEPTGALDSTTSVQIMELLKNIAKTRLVIMVTHNPELAEQYSTRIIKLLDGKITDDSMPYSSENEKEVKDTKKKKSMSIFTALSLSLNNLMTKKGRTLMVAFAGSIGIIGIALILSVSTGVQNYINRVQEDTLSSYPLSIEAERVDMSSMLKTLMDKKSPEDGEKEEELKDSKIIKANAVLYDLMNAANSLETKKNNLTRFKKYIETNEDFKKYSSAIQYVYDAGMDVYTTDPDGKVIKTDVLSLMESVYGGMGVSFGAFGSGNMMSDYYSSYNVWEQMLSGKDGELINPLLSEQYDVISGRWPEKYDEAVLFVNKRNEISDLTLYSLGLQRSSDIAERMEAAMKNEQIDTSALGSWTCDELCNREFRVIIPSACYQKQGDSYIDLAASDAGLSYLYNSDKAITIKLVGVVRPSDDAVAGMVNGSIGYTSALTDELIKRCGESEIIKEQLADESTDILSGLKFANEDDKEPEQAEKIVKIKEYLAALDTNGNAEIYKKIKCTAPEEYLAQAVAQYMENVTRDDIIKQMTDAYAKEMGIEDASAVEEYIRSMSDEEIFAYAENGVRESASAAYAEQVEKQLSAISAEALAAMFEGEKATYTDEMWAALYDNYMPQSRSERTYEEVLALLGYVREDEPTAINIYASTFADKDEISNLIKKYNNKIPEAEKDDRIEYVDYVALIMSSVSTVISAISYVLIAFVAISLIVSSIMIGIITYISVLERTKEIGILRAIGASKKDVARVFNAETLIVGFAAGILGILVTLLLILPLNIILHSLTNIQTLSAVLPVGGAIALVLISMVLTFIAGLIPSKVAAKKDPVIALRTE